MHVDIHQGMVMPAPDDAHEWRLSDGTSVEVTPATVEAVDVEARPLVPQPSVQASGALEVSAPEPVICAPSEPQPAEATPFDRVVSTRVRVCFKSPGSEGEQEKDQDAFAVGPDGSWAAVADGVSSSPHGGEGAREAVKVVRDLLDIDGSPSVETLIARVTEMLHQRRRDFIERPPKSSEKHHEAMRTYLEQVFRQKMEHSAQTTLALVQVSGERATITVVGDSGVFVRAHDETLHERFPPDARPRAPGSRTHVLPDHPDRAIVQSLRLDRSFDLVLATDGFYHVFEDENAMFCWLRDNESTLQSDDATQRLLCADLDTWLHDTLRDARGDDDITAVWITIEVKDGR